MLTIISISVYGCKPRPNLSEAKHVWGETAVSRSTPLDACEVETDAQFPLAKAFIANLAEQLMRANPSTFKGTFDPKAFCFGVMDRPDVFPGPFGEVNGMAFPWSGFVLITPKTFLHAETEADVASIIAHELSHITRQHQHGGASLSYIRHQFSKTAGLQDIQNQIEIEQKHSNTLSPEGSLPAERQRSMQELKSIAITTLEANNKAFVELRDSVRKLDREWHDMSEWDPPQPFAIGGDCTTKYCDIEKLGRDIWLESFDQNFVSYDSGYRGSDRFFPQQTTAEKQARFLALKLAHEQMLVKRNQMTDQLTKFISDSVPDHERSGFIRDSGIIRSDEQKNRDSNERMAKLRVKETQIMLKGGLDQHIIATLREQEADEVGFEIFLRAGFPKKNYSFMSRYFAIQMERIQSAKELSVNRPDTLDDEALLKACMEIRQNELMGVPYLQNWTARSEPYRLGPGRMESHPLPCWRIYNVNVNESREHAAEIEALQAIPAPESLSNPSLGDVRNEVKNHFAKMK
jgi:hypothetical protein